MQDSLLFDFEALGAMCMPSKQAMCVPSKRARCMPSKRAPELAEEFEFLLQAFGEHVQKSLLFGNSFPTSEVADSSVEPLWAKSIADFLMLAIMLIESQVHRLSNHQVGVDCLVTFMKEVTVDLQSSEERGNFAVASAWMCCKRYSYCSYERLSITYVYMQL